MRCLLLSTVSLFVVPAVAIAAPDFISQTHTTPIELKPISPSLGIKTAAICFLGVGDCDPNVGFGSGDENYTLDTPAQCKNEGFVANNCNSVQTPTGYCPYNKSYVSGCKCASNLVTCPAGQVGVGESCNGQYASCKCDPALIACPSNKNGQGASCGGKYQSCVCKSEYVYTSSNCTSPRSVSGSECDGKYTGCSCPAGVSEGTYGCKTYYSSPCTSVCKEAYTDNCHNRTDNNSAVYGCMKTWADCSSKCETPYTDNCRNRTAVISSCPTNATCSYFSDCSSKISSWSCNDGYKPNGNNCILSRPRCNLGDIFYSDNTCVAPANHNTAKTVLGIVVYVNSDGVGGQIMAPWPVDANGNKTNSNSMNMKWSEYGTDILTLPNYITESSASTDYNSCANTDKIVAAGDASTYPAAWAAKRYAPTTETKGKWCLPAAGIMTSINSYNYNNMIAIKNAITAVGAVELPFCCLWSSSEYSNNEAWISYPNYDYGFNHNSKINSFSVYVRPVLEF